MSAATLNDLLKSISIKYGGVFLTGVTTSTIPSNSFTATSLIGADIGSGMQVQLAGATTHRITAFNTTTGIVTFVPSVPSALDTGTAYKILPIDEDIIKEAIAQSINSMGGTWCVHAETTLQWPAGTDEITLPSDCVAVLAVDSKSYPITGVFQSLVPEIHFVVHNNAGTKTIRFLKGAIYLGAELRLSYLKDVNYLTSGSGTLGIGEVDERDALAFITNWACYELWGRAIAKSPTDAASRAWETLRQSSKAAAEALRANHIRPQAQRRVRRMTLQKHI